MLLVAAAAALAVYKLTSDWQAFQNCPNRDVLSWDANLRLIYTLDALDDFTSGHPVRSVVGMLRSPTWPPLHGWIAALLFAWSGPSTVLDASVGFAFYAALCLALAAGSIWIGRQEGIPLWTSAAATLFTLLALFHSKELTAYSLSAMLETQGMFFLWCTLVCLYAVAAGRSQTTGFLLAGSLGLFLTKFPYGHILVMAVIPAALWHERQSFRSLLDFLWTSYRGRAALLPGLLILTVAFLALARFLPGTPPNVKLFKYGFYAVVTILFVDFNVRIYRARNALTWVPHLWRQVYLFLCIPILALTLVEPDRFSSTVGTQLHAQDSHRSFFLSLFSDFLDNPWPLVFLLLAVAGAAGLTFARATERRQSRSPLAFVLLVLLLHIVILEILTSNKQLRHIYHLLPALLLLAFLALVRLSWSLHKWGALLPIAVLGSASLLLTGPGSVLGPAHHSSRYTCWTGPDRYMFQPVRDAVASVPQAGKSTLIMNDFHDLSAPMPGRVWATDLDLLLRFRLDFKARNDSRHTWKEWSEFDRLLHVSYRCDGMDIHPLVQARAIETRSALTRKASYQAAPDAPICITEYQISRNVEIR